ncbi:MAG: exo-beta-N-acetylmuramidase NamZ family protein [Chitinophagaceae bacterium]
MKKLILFLAIGFSAFVSYAVNAQRHILPGATDTPSYIHLLKGKKIAVFANQTSMVGEKHLVDHLIHQNIEVKKIFGPEHGFRGVADAGEKVGNYTDAKTGIPVISLYGAKHKPSKEDLADIDIIVFDIQDVGVRFYTFISSLQELMEAAFIYQKPMVVLDRPNPNGHYVDGPVLDTAFKSFVGMQPIPVVYGMTIGEYAKMLVGERWIDPQSMSAYDMMKLSGIEPLIVIACKNYKRSDVYDLPVKPSPNLPGLSSIYWYPSTCFFEGTVLSEGRGTGMPFQVFGHPSLSKNLFSFTPTSMPGATNPKLKDQLCYGWNVSADPDEVRKKIDGRIHIEYVLEAYRQFPEKDKFFILPKSGEARGSFFNKLAGNDILMKQMQQGMSAEEIRNSWEPGLVTFKRIRQKYLLYK